MTSASLADQLSKVTSRASSTQPNQSAAPTNGKLPKHLGEDTFNDPAPPAPPVISTTFDTYGAHPSFEWLLVRNLVVDSTYQRDNKTERSRSLITRIKENFSWRKFGALYISKRRDGSYRVVEGQHRLTAAKELNLSHVPCLVYPSEADTSDAAILSASEQDVITEAQDFASINSDRKNAGQIDIYHAKLAAGDPETKELNALIEEAGLKVARHTNVAYFRPNEIMATPAVASALKRSNRATVLNALTAIWEAYCSTTSPVRPDRGSRINSPVIQGVCEIYWQYQADPRFDPDRLIRVLGQTDASDWLIAGRKWRDLHRLNVRASVMAAILDQYNRNLRASSVLPKFGPEGH